jgi:ribulose-5-phosphate 4-epimerase/fuculose-1-phosphate aldolase
MSNAPGLNSKQRLAAEVCAVTRMLEEMNILQYSGHIAVRVPGQDALMIQRRSDSRAELVPERIVTVDFDGKVIDGDGKPPSETAIHIETMRARPDVNASLHSHLDLAIAFTMMEGVQLVPMRARSIRWRSGIPMDMDPSHIKTVEQGQTLARTLGPHHAALMRAHGLVLTAESLPALLVDAVHFDENARAQMQVLQAGKTPLPLTDAELEQIDRHEMREFHVGKLWSYYVRKGVKQNAIPGDWDI